MSFWGITPHKFEILESTQTKKSCCLTWHHLQPLSYGKPQHLIYFADIFSTVFFFSLLWVKSMITMFWTSYTNIDHNWMNLVDRLSQEQCCPCHVSNKRHYCCSRIKGGVEDLMRMQLPLSLECCLCLLGHSIIYMLWHTHSPYCSSSHQTETKAKGFSAGRVRMCFCKIDKRSQKDTQAVVHVLQGFFICTQTCLDQLVDEVHLQTVDQGSAICQKVGGRENICSVRMGWQTNQLRLNGKGKNMSNKSKTPTVVSSWATCKAHLTSSFFVLHKDLQLQQPPRNIWVIPHHCQSGLKLPFNTKLHTAISYTNKHPCKQVYKILMSPKQLNTYC